MGNMGTTCQRANRGFVPASSSLKMAKVATHEACRFMQDCLLSVGANSTAAEQQSRLLLQADIYGHPSHGMNRIEMYVNEIKQGVCMPNDKPRILKQSVCTAWIDANNVLGATVSHFAMDVAINKAKETGVGWVTVKGSNHNGIAAYWAQLAANFGYIGLAFTNSCPFVAPTRSKKAVLGTNPICLVAPASNGEFFHLDMATSAAAFGKIEMELRKGNPQIPRGWAQGVDGRMTLDTKEANEVRRLFPLGGEEITSGFKGFGLCAMVELLCGVCSGSKYSHHIRPWSHDGNNGPADLGQCFIVVNPNCFAPCFGERLTDCLESWRKLPRVDPNLPVLAPGDKEKMAAAIVEKTGYITYLQQQIDSCNALAQVLKISPIQVLNDDCNTPCGMKEKPE